MKNFIKFFQRFGFIIIMIGLFIGLLVVVALF